MGIIIDSAVQFAQRRAAAVAERSGHDDTASPRTPIAKAIQENQDALNRAGVFNQKARPRRSTDISDLLHCDKNGRYRLDLPTSQGLFENLDVIAELADIQNRPIIVKIPVKIDDSTSLKPFEMIVSGRMDRWVKLKVFADFRTHEEQELSAFASSEQGQEWLTRNQGSETARFLFENSPTPS